jgi:hypothetical protein
MSEQTLPSIFQLLARAQRDSRSGLVYVVVLGTVRGQPRVFVRDRATHNVVRTDDERMLAVAERGQLDIV